MGLEVLGAALAVVAWLGLPFLFVGVRRWSRRVEAGGGDRTERAHRLRRARAGWSLTLIAAGVVMYAGSNGVQATMARPNSAVNAGVGLLEAAGIGCYLAAVLAVRAIKPSYVRVRDIEEKAPHRGRRVLVGGLSGLLLGVSAGAGASVFPSSGLGVFVSIVVFVGVAVLLNVLLAPAWVFALGATPLPSSERARLFGLAAATGVRIRDICSYPGRGQRQANALQIGTLPGLRYVLVSDYLLDHMTSVEVDAVVAHELGHAKERHVLLKLVAVILLWVGFEGATVALAGGRPASAAVVLVAVLPVAYLFALLVVQGAVGVRLERRADDAAAACVGAQNLASALVALGDLNHMRRRTGVVWNLLGQHPGLDQRIRRLESLSRPQRLGELVPNDSANEGAIDGLRRADDG